MGHKINKDTDLSFLSLDSEIMLIKNSMEFPQVIKNTLNNFEPQTIINYLHDLASKFHKYYANERVVTEDKKTTYLVVASAAACLLPLQKIRKMLEEKC